MSHRPRSAVRARPYPASRPAHPTNVSGQRYRYDDRGWLSTWYRSSTSVRAIPAPGIHSTIQAWNAYTCAAADHPGPGDRGQGRTRPKPTAGTCAGAASKPPSRARPTRMPTGAPRDPRVAGLPPSTRTSIDSATPSSAASTDSNATAAWPPDKLAVRYEASVYVSAINEWL